MTIDEAIKHCLEVVEENECKMTSDDGYTDVSMKRCAAEHRQLAEWLRELKDLREFNDKIYDVLAKQFGSPCNLGYTVDEYMRRNGSCYDCSVEISDKECWSRYIQTKLIGDEPNGI